MRDNVSQLKLTKEQLILHFFNMENQNRFEMGKQTKGGVISTLQSKVEISDNCSLRISKQNVFSIEYGGLIHEHVIAKSKVDALLQFIYVYWYKIITGGMLVFDIRHIVNKYYGVKPYYGQLFILPSKSILSDWKNTANTVIECYKPDDISRHINPNQINFLDKFKAKNLKFIMWCIRNDVIMLSVKQSKLRIQSTSYNIKYILKKIKNNVYCHIWRLFNNS